MAGNRALSPNVRALPWFWRALEPLYAIWRLFTSVRFAVLLLVTLSVVSLLGVVIPQVPASVRGDLLAEARWLKAQEGRFGPLTGVMDRLGLFDVFHVRWFSVLLAVTVVSTASYIVSRLPGIWMTVTRPRRRVPDRYFETAPHRFHYQSPADPLALERVLRRHRYRVERFQEGEATYLFADRFPWAQMGTLLTHAAVVVIIVAAVVSRLGSFSTSLFLAEGATQPLFPVSSPEQIQVQLLDAVGRFDEGGRPLDYRSRIVIYQRGEEVKRCESTVNSPCSYGGYRFHQAAYFGFGAEVQVRDLASGNVIYRETLALFDSMPSPRVLIRDEKGQVLLDDSLVLTDVLSTEEFLYYGTLVRLPQDRLLAVGVQRPTQGGDWTLTVLEPGLGEESARLALKEGESGTSGGLEVSYLSTDRVPAAFVSDFPLPPTVEGGGLGEALLEMSNVVYGTGTTSEGRTVDAPSGDGPPTLSLVGLQPQAVVLEPGQSARIGGYEYTFLGQREFAGLQVRRDRSDLLVWIGAGMVILGLMITFWVPRRRLWAKITAGHTFLAGQPPQAVDYRREMRRLAQEAGAQLPPEEAEDD